MKTIQRYVQYMVLLGVGGLIACSQFEPGYFQSKVDQVTQEVVAGRYGEPHNVEQLSEERSVWTYFD